MRQHDRLDRQADTHTPVAVLCGLVLADYYSECRRAPALFDFGHSTHGRRRRNYHECCRGAVRDSAGVAGISASNSGVVLTAAFARRKIGSAAIQNRYLTITAHIEKM